MLLCDVIVFWVEHFRQPHIGLQMQFAKSETEYGALVELAGYKMVRRKKRWGRKHRK